MQIITPLTKAGDSGVFVAGIDTSPNREISKISYGMSMEPKTCDTCWPEGPLATKSVYNKKMDFTAAACDKCADAHKKHGGFGLLTHRDTESPDDIIVSPL